jgi:hypothetical protein
MKTITQIFLAVFITITMGCEGNTTGQYRHKPGHHSDEVEKPEGQPTNQ